MASAPQSRRFHLTPKQILFSFIGLMLVYVLLHTEHFLIDSTDPEWPHYRDIARSLLPHGLVGALALALSLTQFSTRLRTRYPRFHLVCGRIYVTSVCLVAPLGVYLSYLDEQIGYTSSFVFASATFAFLWLLATGMAFGFIRLRKIDNHRQWMTRSLAMALVFLEVRVIGGLTGWESTPSTDTIIVWICVSLGYPIADLVLEVERALRAAPASARQPRPESSPVREAPNGRDSVPSMTKSSTPSSPMSMRSPSERSAQVSQSG